MVTGRYNELLLKSNTKWNIKWPLRPSHLAHLGFGLGEFKVAW